MIENSTQFADGQTENQELNQHPDSPIGSENNMLSGEEEIQPGDASTSEESALVQNITESEPVVANDHPTFEAEKESQLSMETTELNEGLASEMETVMEDNFTESTASEANIEESTITAENQEPVNLVEPMEAKSEQSEAYQEPEQTGLELEMVEDHELEAMEKEEQEAEIEDYSGLDKEQLVKLVEQLNRDDNSLIAYRSLQKIRPLFENLFHKDQEEAKEKFIAEGGDPETFEYKFAALGQRFQQAVRGINEKRKINLEVQNKEKSKNLEAKLSLLEQLRQLVGDHEHTPGYERFKEIREEWKKIGPVGSEHVKDLNNSYFALVDQFYSLSGIYQNLRDFDRKKNLEHKLEIISRIEKLAEEPRISKAMKDLMSLMEEYRSTGPVPREKLDELKLRLKNAVDIIYNRRKAFNEERKQLAVEEQALKEAILAKVAEFESFTSSMAKEWQDKTKEILVLQEEWKQIPNQFREKSAELNKQFWGIFKKFIHNKNEYFKSLEKNRKETLHQKQALVDEVNNLKDGEDFDGISNRMKELQQEWKKIAPVFGKDGQKVYDQFKAGIDHFFSRLRDQRSGEEKEQLVNLSQKEAICAEIESMAKSGSGSKALVDELKEKFRAVGFVPMKAMQKINGRFSKAMLEMIDAAKEIPEREKERLKISLLSNRSTYSSEGIKTLKNQEGYIQKRLQQLRKDVGNLEDNMAMFKMSKNAMAIIEDYQKRINVSRLEIKDLEAQLKDMREGEQAGK